MATALWTPSRGYRPVDVADGDGGAAAALWTPSGGFCPVEVAMGAPPRLPLRAPP